MAQEIVDQGEGMAVDSVMEAEEDEARNGEPERRLFITAWELPVFYVLG